MELARTDGETGAGSPGGGRRRRLPALLECEDSRHAEHRPSTEEAPARCVPHCGQIFATDEAMDASYASPRTAVSSHRISESTSAASVSVSATSSRSTAQKRWRSRCTATRTAGSAIDSSRASVA